MDQNDILILISKYKERIAKLNEELVDSEATSEKRLQLMNVYKEENEQLRAQLPQPETPAPVGENND
jgi:regulator of replication initiation timing